MDPAGIITVIGLAVAIYAIVPREQRLDLSLRISKLDRIIILICFFVIHYIIFYPTLDQFGLAYNLGSWKYGFNQENTIYLIFLFLGIFLFHRAKNAKVSRSNIQQMSELMEEQLSEGKYADLAILVENHVENIAKIQKTPTFRNRLSDKISPITHTSFVLHQDYEPSWLERHFAPFLSWLGEIFYKHDPQAEVSDNVLRRILTNKNFVQYLSKSRPYLALTIIDLGTRYTESFLGIYFSSIIDDRDSIFYYELKNNSWLAANQRFHIPKNNRLLFYFFRDVRVAERLKVYKYAGNAVYTILDSDSVWNERCNSAIGAYVDNESLLCPLDTTVRFFEIMLIEAMHQGIRWHMWLFYLSGFSTKILNNLAPLTDVDLEREFPTPYHYHLYKIVTVLIDLLQEYEHVSNKEPISTDDESLNHANSSIPKSAAIALGSIVYEIVSSTKVTDEFKIYTIEILGRHFQQTRHCPELAVPNTVLMKAALKDGFHNRIDQAYVKDFARLFSQIDHVIRWDTKDLNTYIDSLRGQY
ncbi:MAG: hypothetical protein ACJA2O_004742 [Candidatus Azotimanducaceae bacterium]|jgi:hypothetical protein